MHPELERQLVATHLEELHRMAGMAGPARRRQPSDDVRMPRNRPRVRAGLVLMRVGARLAKPALLPSPRQPEVLMGR